MSTATRQKRKPTELQRKYLRALKGGRKTGKQFRRRLRRWGVRCSDGAFYRVVKRLRDNGLLNSEHIRRSDDDYRGQEYYYKLTPAGGKVAKSKLKLVKGRPRRRPGMTLREMIAQGRVSRGK